MDARRDRRAGDAALLFLSAFALYFLLDFPIRISGAYDFPFLVGMKSFLPMTMGVFFGAPGIAGCVLGAGIGGVLLGSPVSEILTECICITAAGLISRAVWYLGNRNGNVRIETPRHFAQSILAGILCTLVHTAAAWIVIGQREASVAGLVYIVLGALVAVLVHVLMGNIFCVEPVTPKWSERTHDMRILLRPDDRSPGALNDQIEEIAPERGVSMKRIFELENCIEELYIRIRKELPESEVTGYIDLGTTNSLRLFIPGKKYDPLRAGKDEDAVDLLSLTLIRHRALRASCAYRGGENRIHIVL